MEIESTRPVDLKSVLENAAEDALDMDAFLASEAKGVEIRAELVEQVSKIHGTDGLF